MALALQADPQEIREKFFLLETPRDIASLLELDYSRLVYHLYIVPREQKYTSFTLKKRGGGEREIDAPATALKVIQRKLATVLEQVYKPKAPTHGYVAEKSIVTNARMHCRRRYVLNLDLINFFPSITFKRVRGLFRAVPYSRNYEVATWLAHICCWNGSLPQGAPTSPIISNMICASMDSQIRRLAVKHKCVYTRYADDLTFSTSLRQFPSSLAIIEDSKDGRAISIGEELKSLIWANGFEVNSRKTRLQTANRRQEVTGLTVNRFPNVNRRYLNQVRAMLHDWQKNGYEAAEKEFYAKWDSSNRSPFKSGNRSFARVVKGKIEFLGMVRGKNDSYYLRFLEQLATLAPQMVKLTSTELRSLQIGQKRLREALENKFSMAELNTLCFDLNIDFENIPGTTKSEKVVELIKYMDRHDRYQELFDAVEQSRPGSM
jgi:RNA-directed DNA polymerase